MANLTANRIYEGCRRLGIIVGLCAAAIALTIGGLVIWATAQEHGWIARVVVDRVFYTIITAIVAYFAPQVVLGILAWIAEGFITGKPTDVATRRALGTLIVVLAVCAGALIGGFGLRWLTVELLQQWPWPIDFLVDITHRNVDLARFVEKETLWAIYREAIAIPIMAVGWIAGIVFVVWLIVKLDLSEKSFD